MKRILILACAIVATLTSTAFALTVDRDITADYVRQHPDEFSVRVSQGTTGLIDFTISHNVASPMYHVASLAIYHGGTLIAETDTPSFGKRRDNRFHFSIAPESIAECKFSLSDSALSGSGEDAVPIPGTIIHRFRLADFVPTELLAK